MCFSAGVSFGASAIIGATGAIALSKTRKPSQRFFAMIPMFFAVQQFAEGLTWLSLSYLVDPARVFWMPATIYVFISVAWVVLPSLVPYSIYRLEQVPNRKRILKWFSIVGAALSAFLIYVLLTYPMHATIHEFHIKYALDFTHPLIWILTIPYVIVTVISCLVSSVKWMEYVGLVNVVSFIFSNIAFKGTVASTWCFFAAVSSVLVVAILIQLGKPHTKSSSTVKDLEMG